MHDQPSRISMGVCSALDESQSVIDNDVGGALDTPQFNELPDLSVERVLDPVQLGAMFCNSFLKCRTGLSQFIKLSLSDSLACNVQGSLKRPPIWPVPPPRWRWSASSGLGVKRRKQLRYHRTRHRLLQLIICSLNWEVLGHPTVPPRHAVLGASISSQQHDVICRLENFVDHLLHGDSFLPSDLGRASEKFHDLIQQVQGFPQSLDQVSDEDILNLLAQLQSQFDPYSSHFGREKCSTKQSADTAESEHPFCFPAVQTSTHGSAAGSKPVVASRVKWEYPPSFEAGPFLSNGVVRAAFENPEVLRKPSEEWPKARPAIVHCSREELLSLADRWDSLGACSLVPLAEKSYDEAVGLFCVPKNAEHDRLIVNPTVINSRMHSISDFTKGLAPGAMLSLLHLKPSDMFRISADDLTDYYYTFRVSESRAKRNSLRCIFKRHEVQHLSCFNESDPSTEFLVALKTLAMGDSLAVEVAQQSHFNVLSRLCGAMIPSEVLQYRKPVPRSDFVELLAIDDHVGIQRLPIDQFKHQPPLRDTIIFSKAEKAYKKVGLIQQEKKRKRYLKQATVLGCDFDGEAGIAMAPRSRIQVLSQITLIVASKGVCTPKVLSILTGCWVHIFLFRRALFSVMDVVFREGQDKPNHIPFQLSRKCRNELQLMSVLGFVALSDLRVTHSPHLYSTDASPTGGAVVMTHIGASASAELWRHTEQKGFYTRLQSPVTAYLEEKGLDPDPNSVCPDPKQMCDRQEIFDSIPKALQEGILFDVLEIFRGSGNWTSCHAAAGLRAHDGFDVDGRRLRVGNIADRAICHELISLAFRRVIGEWHAGLPCLSFGTLRRPQVRSKLCPFGFNPKDPFTAFHNALAIKTCLILTVAVQMGQYISVEQPGSSRLFLLNGFRRLLQLGCVISHFAFCSYGSAFQKRSKWLHNKPWLVPLESKCQCPAGHKHFVVQGSFTRETRLEFLNQCSPSCLEVYGREPSLGEAVSAFSAAYPLTLMDQMSSGSRAAHCGHVGRIDDSIRDRSFREVGEDLVSADAPWSQELPYPDRPWFQDPEWIEEICDSLKFTELFRFKFRQSGHINVNETRTYKTWLKAVAKREPDSRFVGVLDSRVTIGAAAKGRSSSYSLSRVLQGSVAYVIGGGLYPGCLHCGSSFNRADEPSRDRPVQEPKKQIPFWLQQLLDGNPKHFDQVRVASRFEKNPARWLRFLLLLCGDIEENPGPPHPRGPLDLTIGFAPATADRMQKCLSAFRHWIVENLDVPWSTLTCDHEAMCWCLRAYGLHCFSSGLPRYLFVYAITAVQDQHPGTRPFMSVAWHIDKKWQAHEPGQCRAVLPACVIRAATCLAVIWGWSLWAGLVLLGFSAMLHPAEMLQLTRRDLVFPRDLEYDMQCLFIHVRNPKTSRFARRQHGRVDDPFTIKFLEHLYFKLPLDARLFPWSISVFRRQWNHVMDKLEIPRSQAKRGATPGVLRGSGATYLYAVYEDIPWIAWRGRWSRTRTLEFYLQEVAAQLLLHELTPIARAKIRQFDAAAFDVLCSFQLTA